MKKIALAFILMQVLILADTLEAAGRNPSDGALPRYIPPAQTRDEIIREELRKQEMQNRKGPALVVRFAAGGVEVRPADRRAIAEFAGYLEGHPELTATLAGYTDSTGAPEENLELSERRARALKEVLVREYRIDESRLSTEGRGQDNPVASNGTAAGRQKNRRVEVFIGSK